MQDQVPPFPSDTAISIVEEELGAPLNNIFERFDYEPIAAASLGKFSWLCFFYLIGKGNQTSMFSSYRSGSPCKIEGEGSCC